MFSLFAYGTLRDPDVLRLVLGRNVASTDIVPATAPGCRVVFFPGRTYPALRRQVGGAAVGTLVNQLTNADMALLDRFEGPEYKRAASEIIVSGAPAQADIYWPAIDISADAEDWHLEGWQAQYKAAFLAREAESLDQLRQQLSALPR